MHNGEAQARALSKEKIAEQEVGIIDDETKPSPISFPNDREQHRGGAFERWGAPTL